MLELRGREIRTTEMRDGVPIVLKSGQQLQIGCDNPREPSDNKKLMCNYKDLPRAVKLNDIISIDDGKIICLVTDCDIVTSSAY